MLKVKSSKSARLNKKLVLAALVGGLTFTSPLMSTRVFAEENEEVLFEDQEDDYKTEDIKEDDVVKDNTVVDPVQEEKKEEQKQEEKKNDGGSCVTPDNGYNEEEGKYWDPNIKTEAEKKGLVPDTPPETPPTPPVTPPETPETPETPSTPAPTPTPTPAPAPAPAPAPKTGDISLSEIFALLAGLSVTVGGLSYINGKKAYNNTLKRK